MTTFEKRRLDRFRYWQGQMLRSADFQAQAADTAQHRWWHNRALHNAFGVYQGLTAYALSDSSGQLSGVRIAPGVAYDCFGRELIVDSPQRIKLPVNVPPPPVKMWLLVRYDSQADCSAHAMEEICWSSSGTQGTVTFTWLPKDQVHLRDGVALAEVDYDSTGRNLSTTFVRPGARPISRPKIASGATVPAATVWGPWTIDTPIQIPSGGKVLRPTSIGVSTRIDTSAAGFTQTPCYFAWLAGPLFNASSGQLLPDMFCSLSDESPTGFTFQMWFPPPPPPIALIELASPSASSASSGLQIIRSDTDFYPFARRQKLYVQWLACQMPTTVPYIPLQLRMLNEFLLPLVLQKPVLLNPAMAINIAK